MDGALKHNVSTDKEQVSLGVLQERVIESAATGVLHLENLWLQELPKGFFLPIEISTLKLQNNELKAVPEAVFSLVKLEALELNANNLSSLPSSIRRLPNLKTLYLHNNRLTCLPTEIGELTNLTCLQAHGNRLHDLTLELCHCVNLKELSLGDNPWHAPFVDVFEIPLEIVLRALRMLYISRDRQELHLTSKSTAYLRASSIETSAHLCTTLTSLALSYIKVGELDSNIATLSLLRYLSIHHSKIHTVCEGIDELISLEYLDMRNNSIENMPAMSKMKLLRFLFLDDNNFTVFPNALLKCVNLTVLSLRCNGIDEIPLGVASLGSLSVLCLGHNKLIDLPVDFGRLWVLKFLEVVGNGVENMPVELLGDAAKVSLKLETDEPVEEGPLDGPLLTQEWDRGVAQMTAAAEDHEESTQVFLAYLRKLEPAFLSDTKLDLSGLGLIAVPISMLAFTHLTAVSLANNKISQLPLALAGLHRLCTLDLAGNPGIDFFLPEVLVHEPHRPIELLSRLRAAIGEQTAELSGLRLRLLPACVFELMGLVNLDVKDNEIIALPEDFGSHAAFEGLRSLNVSKNRLRGIPASLGLLTALTALHCSYNDLRSIAPEVALCTSLTSLKLDNNPALDSPPPSVVDAGLEACLSYLKVLLLARYNTTLLLEGRGMRRVPVDLLDYPHLTEVSVAQNAIVDLPQSICSMKTLATLCIAHNQITALPEAIGRMDGLRFLRAEHNRIALVPASFCRLSRLQVCDFSSNLLTWLPNTIGNMNSLSELLVTDNPLRTPPLDIVEQGTFRILRFLRMLGSSESSCSLNLNALGLRTLPLLICRQTALTELKLFKNRISELPLKAGRLTSLTHLVLSSNQLSALPDVVHHWNRMERLYLDDNRLTILPDSICLLLHLKELRAAGNMLEQLPSSIGSLQQLVLIDVARNRLRGLPASISLLTKMQKLRLGGNQFRKIMDELAELQLLEELNVSDNLLLDLPPDLCNLYNLSFLHAEGNERLFSPPPEIRRKGLADMMKYLRRVLNARETMVLDLAWLGLKNLYLDPDRLSGLTTLNLSGNAFEDLPEQIPNLTCLKTLTFDENRLRVLPPGLGAITSLTKLSFKGNPVESPPEEVIDRGTEAILIYLRRLWDSRLTEKLDLSSQGIETLHVSVCHLTALTELTLDKNRCKTIPFEIEGLSRLTYLSIRDNLLEVLPSTLGRLVNISVLLLDNNPTMPALPSEMCGLHCLTTFGFSGNEFLSPGMEICSKGVTAMLAYLSAVHQSIVSKKIELQSFGMLGFAADLVARPTVISIDVSNNYLESMNNGFFFW